MALTAARGAGSHYKDNDIPLKKPRRSGASFCTLIGYHVGFKMVTLWMTLGDISRSLIIHLKLCIMEIMPDKLIVTIVHL